MEEYCIIRPKRPRKYVFISVSLIRKKGYLKSHGFHKSSVLLLIGMIFGCRNSTIV